MSTTTTRTTPMALTHSYESYYHGMLLGLFKIFIHSNAYTVFSNREAGYGRPDLLILKKDRSLGIVIEFKLAKTLNEMENEAKDGLEQLKDKNYKLDFLEGKIKNVNEFVIVFHGRCAIVR